MTGIKAGRIDPFNTTQIHIDFIRVRARDIKRRHTASGAEMVSGKVCIEGIGSEFLPRRQQTETLARNYPVKIAFFGANRAVALRNSSVYRPGNFVNHATTMAYAAVDRATFEFIRHKYECGANRTFQQMRCYAISQFCATK